MLPQKSRIHKADFKTFGRGEIYHSPVLSLAVYKKSDASQSQFSFLCSKKVAKSAVTRNRLRRQGYASIEKVISTIASGHYCVFSYKKTPKQATFSEISTAVIQLLTQSHLI